MGSSPSKPKPLSREEQLKKDGVLIPPMFAITGHGATTAATVREMPYNLSTWDRLPLSPSPFDALMATHFGQGLLLDSMTPGIWVLAGGRDANASTTIRASLPQTSDRGGRISLISSPSSSNVLGSSRVELRAGTDGPFHLLVNYPIFANSGLFYGDLNTMGAGYLGGQLRFTIHQNPKKQNPTEDSPPFLLDLEDEENPEDNKIHLQLGSWIPFKANTKGSLKWKGKQSDLLQPADHVHGFVSVDMLGTTTVVETKCNLNTLENEVSKYFSMRLYGDSKTDDTDDSLAMPAPKSPPLWLTMTSTPQQSTINISQFFTFDRLNLNFLNQSAPRVRNTVGWSIQLEKPNNEDDETNSPSQLSLGAVWQVNRGLGFKIVGTSNQTTNTHTLTYAVLLKRWKAPRVSINLLGRSDTKTQKHGFFGIGLELEAADILGSDKALYAPSSAKLDSAQEVPATKPMLD